MGWSKGRGIAQGKIGLSMKEFLFYGVELMLTLTGVYVVWNYGAPIASELVRKLFEWIYPLYDKTPHPLHTPVAYFKYIALRDRAAELAYLYLHKVFAIILSLPILFKIKEIIDANVRRPVLINSRLNNTGPIDNATGQPVENRPTVLVPRSIKQNGVISRFTLKKNEEKELSPQKTDLIDGKLRLRH